MLIEFLCKYKTEGSISLGFQTENELETLGGTNK